MKPSHYLILVRVLLVANALVFLEFGFRFFFFTRASAEKLGIQLNDAAAVADFRAFYGALIFCLGIFFAACAVKRNWFQPGLLVVALTSLFLLAGRVFSFVLAGQVFPSMYVPVVLETLSGLLAIFLMTRAGAVERATV